MNSSSAKLLVCVGDKVVCIKIDGRANFTSSVDFQTLVHSLRERGYARFVVELSDCSLMDSTFLGVLAGIGLNLAKAQNANHDAGMVLLNPKPRITELLENLGIIHLFKIEHCAEPAKESFDPLQTGEKSRLAISRTCLEAHQTLMAVNPENIPKFKDVTKFLAEDLKRMEMAQADKPTSGG
ncbi:MAG TPA: STAS domain-containing protein [Candidatus Eisenbacteria bacterium]|jgi:anti-anti-sigma factor|nr:STAS domain-containing protein [Candidatus Eisenbacteria bacterium]